MGIMRANKYITVFDEIEDITPEQWSLLASRLFFKRSTMSEMKTTEEKRTFDTGAKKHLDTDKPRPDLISPIFMLRVGDWLAKGAKSYGARNWEKGIPISELIASLERHLQQFKLGEEDEDHVAAMGCCIMFLTHTLEMVKRGKLPASLDDMPYYYKEEAVPQIWCTCDACGKRIHWQASSHHINGYIYCDFCNKIK